VDLAVHSLKDMPAGLPEGLRIGAISEREDPRDALITRSGQTLDELPSGARIGTSSLRRKAQLLQCRPDLEIVPLRGNINTRLRKLDETDLDGIVLAAAGLRRMGWDERISELFDPADWIPAVGQGALAVELRAHDLAVEWMVAQLDHPDTRDAVTAERAFLTQIGGSCQVPVGAYACCDGERLTLTALIADPTGQRMFRETRQGNRGDAHQLGIEVAEAILTRGGAAVLAEVSKEG
jgi:hydroxymethylbilane synthase